MQGKAMMVEFRGRTVSLRDLCKERSIPFMTVYMRLRAGKTLEDSLSDTTHRIPPKIWEYNGEALTLSAWALKLGLSKSRLEQRIKAGRPLSNVFSPRGEQSVPRQRGAVCAEWLPTIKLPWELDTFAQDVVRNNPGGMELQKIADLMGVCRQRVEQIEESAFAKLRKNPTALAALQEAIELQAGRKTFVEPEPVYWGDAHQVGRAKRDRRQHKEAA